MSRVKTAMVLAAGLGTRMRPLSLTRPKCLVTVGGRTLIDHMLDRLIGAGVERAVVNVHAFADMLEAHVRARKDIEIVVSDERETLLETGGGVRKALSYLGADPFFVCNTDSIWEERGGSALKKMSDSFDADRMDALLLLADKEESMGFEGAGDFFRETDGRIQHRGAAEAAPFAYTGVQFVTPRIVAPEPIEPFSFMRIWRRVMAEGRMYGAPLDGFWMHVGDPVARDAAEARLETAFAS